MFANKMYQYITNTNKIDFQKKSAEGTCDSKKWLVHVHVDQSIDHSEIKIGMPLGKLFCAKAQNAVFFYP